MLCERGDASVAGAGSNSMNVGKAGPVAMGIVGCGRISKSHLEAVAALADFGRIAAITDIDANKAAQVARTYSANAVQSFEAMLERPDIDAVLLCTPNDQHAQQSIAAMRAGKHVLVEKPMAETAADARRMAEVARATGKVLAVGQTFRHCDAVRYIQDHWQDFGKLLAIEVSQCVFWDGPQAPWWATRSPDEGVILSLFAPHSLDFVQMCMRDAPLRVHAEVARHQDRWRGEDEAMILLGYADRRMASVHISYNQRHLVDRKLLSFDRGVLRLEDGLSLFWNDAPIVTADDAGSPDLRRMGARSLSGYFHLQFAEFAKAVRGEVHRSVLPDEGVQLIELIDRVKLAARDSRESVL